MRAVQDRSLRLPLPAVTGAEQKPAGASELCDSLVVCTDGWEACELSKVAQAKISDSEHQQNVTNCSNASPACDRSKLTAQETIALAVADHKRGLGS
jgi:hypothetical protein